MAQLHKSICKLVKSAERENLTPCIRLNGTSDIGWQKLGIFEQYPEVQFYDYTKGIKRIMENDHANYHLTFSRSESNHKTVERVLADTSVNVAAVFSTKRNDGLPTSYMGRRVIDGDLHDLRFLDAQNCIVGLRAKGDARQDQSGFVIHA